VKHLGKIKANLMFGENGENLDKIRNTHAERIKIKLNLIMVLTGGR
jgi:hypothetical protein